MSILGLGDVLTPLEREGCRLADAGCTVGGQSASLGGKLDGILSSFGLVVFVVGGFVLAQAMRHLLLWQTVRVAGADRPGPGCARLEGAP